MDSLPDIDPRTSSHRPGCGLVVLGVVLVLIGIPMLVCPGPGTAVILTGVGMVAGGLGLSKRERV